MGRKKHLDFLKEFKKSLSRRIQIDRMILFGSRAEGKAKRWSDFDLVIVSKNFKNKRFRKRASNMYDFWKIEYPVDFLCYTPEEFNKLKKQVTIVKEAVETGIEI